MSFTLDYYILRNYEDHQQQNQEKKENNYGGWHNQRLSISKRDLQEMS
jgi:hypothetical protein